MALTDIINRITQDAEKQAAQLIATAEAQAKERINECKRELKIRSKATQEKREAETEQYTLQQTQIQKFISDQKLLTAKRAALASVITQTKEAVLANEKLRAQVYAYAFSKIHLGIERIAIAKADMGLLQQSCPIEPSEVPLGTCIAYQGKAQLDCSLPIVIEDIAQANEGLIAQELFKGA